MSGSYDNKRFDDLGIEVDFPVTIHIGIEDVRTPLDIRYVDRFGDRLIVSLDPESEGSSHPSFSLPDSSRTVFAIDSSGEIEWFAEGISHPEVEEFHHRTAGAGDMYDDVDDSALVSGSNVGKHRYRLDPETGEIIDSWLDSDWEGLVLCEIEGLVEGRESSLRLPYQKSGIEKPIGDDLVLGLDPDRPAFEDPDIEIADPSQNLIRLTPDATVRWVVEALDADGGDPHHEEVWLHDERLITRLNTGAFTELDRNTGAVAAT